MGPHSDPVQPTDGRRTFFRRIIAFAAAVIGVGLAVPLAGYVVSPALKRREARWSDIGPVDQLTPGIPKQLEYVTTVRDGYMESRIRKAVWALKQGDGEVVVYSPLCTHLGCGYTWDVADSRFECPCHLSKFSVNGDVIGGPAPRPLDRLPSRVENGRLLVIYKEFKAGLPKRVEI
jgi:menaquinol-cytochrome c reductase iron-sulfur subunit